MQVDPNGGLQELHKNLFGGVILCLLRTLGNPKKQVLTTTMGMFGPRPCRHCELVLGMM
jgi:hypothetical protein